MNNSFGHFDFEFSWLWGITALFGRAEKEDDISIKILGLEGQQVAFVLMSAPRFLGTPDSSPGCPSQATKSGRASSLAAGVKCVAQAWPIKADQPPDHRDWLQEGLLNQAESRR